MLIQPIQNINCCGGKKQSPAFGSIGLYKDCFGVELIQVWNTAKKEDAQVLINGERYYPLISRAAKEATNMLRTLGEKITKEENLSKLRELLTKAVGIDIMPGLEKERPLSGNRTCKLKGILGGDVAIANYKTVAQKGTPKYHAKGSKSESSYEFLSIELDPHEKFNVSLSREEIAQLGKMQP